MPRSRPCLGGVGPLGRWRVLRRREVVLDRPASSVRTAPPPSSGSIAASACPPAPFSPSGLTWEPSASVSTSTSSAGKSSHLSCLRMAAFSGHYALATIDVHIHASGSELRTAFRNAVVHVNHSRAIVPEGIVFRTKLSVRRDAYRFYDVASCRLLELTASRRPRLRRRLQVDDVRAAQGRKAVGQGLHRDGRGSTERTSRARSHQHP